MLSPYKANVTNGDVIDFGVVGPAQTFSVSFWPKVNEGGVFGKGGYYDYAYAETPPKWEMEGSDLYGRPLYVSITPSPTTPEGEYTIYIHIIDEGNYEKLGNISLKGRVRITHNVMKAFPDKHEKIGEIYSNISFKIYVKNLADAGGVFIVKSMDEEHPFFKEFYVPPKSSRQVTFNISSEEEESYTIPFIVYPKYCPYLNQTFSVKAKFVPSVLGDIKALPNGIVVFPYASGILYFFLSIIGYLLHSF
jgi:hypothetical protein